MNIEQDVLALPYIRQYPGFITVPQTVLQYRKGKKNKRTLDVMKALHKNLNSKKI